MGEEMQQRDEDYEAVGRALGWLVSEAAAREQLRPGLEALARLIGAALGEGATSGVGSAEALTDVVTESVLAEAPATPSLPEAPDTSPDTEIAAVVGEAPERQPIDIKQAIADVLRSIAREQQEAETTDEQVVEASPTLLDPAAAEERRDAALGALAQKLRVRAALATSVAESIRTGLAVDERLIHDARSLGASTWACEVGTTDAEAVEAFAACLDATADAAELWIQLAKHGITDRARRSRALHDLAAVQSALRKASLALRPFDDEDQVAIHKWLKDTTWALQIFVGRHMTLDDPLDPGRVGEVVGQLQDELQELRAHGERQTTLKKRLGALRYHAGRVDQGKHTSHDLDKLVECSVALVEAGMPPSSLDLRNQLLPIFDLLPPPDGQDVRYGRVVAELQAQLDRVAEEADAADSSPAGDSASASIVSPGMAVALARRDLPGIVIPETAVENIAEIDGAEEARAWGRSTWRALRALDAFAQEAASYRGFWDWCATSGHHFAWPASSKKLAINESLTVMNGFRDERVFKVDAAVSPDGEMLMPAHCKIAEGGGRLSPRLYFHDDTKGRTGKVHIGFIGPHRYVPNASTN